jgi:hypothetical protein
MRIISTLLASLLFLSACSQDLTGIWRGSFLSADNKMMDLFNLEDRYKYEVQIDQHNKTLGGVTYSYKTTVFYGKASANGSVNTKTGKVILQELKLLELKMTPESYACWMICFLQYTKNGEEEFMEGKYSSYRETDSSFCGKGTVFLRKVVTSDFYKEPFLANREKEKQQQRLLAGKKSDSTKAVITDIAKKPVTKLALVKKQPDKKPVAPLVAKNNKPKTVAKSKETVSPSTIDPRAAPVISKLDTDKKGPVIKTRDMAIVPPVLRNRENEVVQSIVVNSNDITISIYDNGTIDHDTVSVYLDKKLIVSKQMLTTNAIVVKLKMDESTDYHELVMVADNLGDIPPNTSLMVVKAGDKRYEVRITSTEQKNAVVIFKFEKPK